MSVRGAPVSCIPSPTRSVSLARRHALPLIAAAPSGHTNAGPTCWSTSRPNVRRVASTCALPLSPRTCWWHGAPARHRRAVPSYLRLHPNRLPRRSGRGRHLATARRRGAEFCRRAGDLPGAAVDRGREPVCSTDWSLKPQPARGSELSPKDRRGTPSGRKREVQACPAPREWRGPESLAHLTGAHARRLRPLPQPCRGARRCGER